MIGECQKYGVFIIEYEITENIKKKTMYEKW